MTRRELAKKVAREYLKRRCRDKYVLLFHVACEIDSVFRKKFKWKRKVELHSSLFDYTNYVPNAKWVPAEKLTNTLCRGLAGKFYVVENPYYQG